MEIKKIERRGSDSIPTRGYELIPEGTDENNFLEFLVACLKSYCVNSTWFSIGGAFETRPDVPLKENHDSKSVG